MSSGTAPSATPLTQRGQPGSCGLAGITGPRTLGRGNRGLWPEGWWCGPLRGGASGRRAGGGFKVESLLTAPPSGVLGRGCLGLKPAAPTGKGPGHSLPDILPWPTDHLGQQPTWSKWPGPARGLLERDATCRPVQDHHPKS